MTIDRDRQAACHVTGASSPSANQTEVQCSQAQSGQKERINANFSPTLNGEETPPLSHSLMPIEKTFLKRHVPFCIHAAGTMFGWWKIQVSGELKIPLKFTSYIICALHDMGD